MSDCKSCRFLRDTGKQLIIWSAEHGSFALVVDGDGQHPGRERVDRPTRYECRIRAPGWVHEDGAPACMYALPPDLLGCGEWQAKADGAAIPEGYQVLERGEGDWIALGPEKYCVAAESTKAAAIEGAVRHNKGAVKTYTISDRRGSWHLTTGEGTPIIKEAAMGLLSSFLDDLDEYKEAGQ